MRRLAGELEHLDGALRDRAVLAGNLRDLRRINRLFGGTALSLRAVRALVERTPGSTPVPHVGDAVLRVLDVGTGAADIPVAIARSSGPWQDVHVTAIDSRSEVIEAARVINPDLASDARIELAVADGLGLPYPDGAFDVAHASLVLHHLEPDAAVPFLRELGRVARVGVVVNDLGRGRLAWLGAWLVLHAITRNAFTLHDGPLSVRRAYTRREARELLAEAGLIPSFEAGGLAGHRWVIAAVHR
jgi:ubiquinone/menaquinone biosynthesis C-methylase UbiE